MLADKKRYDIELGPTNHIRGQKFKFRKGHQVQVMCALLEEHQEDMLASVINMVAREVRFSGRTLRLRGQEGHPVWRPSPDPD